MLYNLQEFMDILYFGFPKEIFRKPKCLQNIPIEYKLNVLFLAVICRKKAQVVEHEILEIKKRI